MTTQTKPLLIYDRDCGFCVYWIHYWQQLTEDRVIYKPYQEVASLYPDIPIETFQRAIQYIAPDGKVSSAAKATFLTLSHAPSKAFWLWFYRWVPGFAFVSEKIYALIASHRPFFYRISVFLWGQHLEPAHHDMIAWLFLRGIGLVFFFAFFSFSTQALGLIGSQGLIPISELLTAAQNQLGHEAYWLLPNVFWLNPSDFVVQAICWGGMLLSLCLTINIFPRICLLLLYVFYLSLIYAGQLFMSFQWDLLLIESGVIAFFLVGSTTIGIWLLRWLLFRFILVSGLVKLTSGDPTWRNFTALYYHFFTQPLPTPIAWYADKLPHSILTFGTFAALLIELVAPFLIFFPRRLRFVSAYSILLMQGLILLTGNYNFFNILAILLCFTLFDDAALRKIIPQQLMHRLQSKKKPSYKLMTIFTGVFATVTVFVSVVQFHLKFGGNVPAPVLSFVKSVAPLNIVNTYGPFAVMTTKRMEIIIEGSQDGFFWDEYAFKYKPGDVFRPPLWNIPLQPRLDWQLWFAALGTLNENPWVLRVFQRLLENSSAVIGLLENNPFPDGPPRYIRALFYEYRFTDMKERKTTGAWWTRKLVSIYCPPVHLE